MLFASAEDKMIRIITLTILSDIGGCIAMLVYYALSHSLEKGIILGIFTFGNVLFPTLITVLMFQLIKGRTTFPNHLITTFVRIALLLFLIFVGLFLWATAEAVLFTTLTWKNIIDDLNSQFFPFLPVAFAIAFLIPLIDQRLTKPA